MTVQDLIELLSQSPDQNVPVVVRVWEQRGEDPLLSVCGIRDVTEGRGTIVIDVEQA